MHDDVPLLSDIVESSTYCFRTKYVFLDEKIHIDETKKNRIIIFININHMLSKMHHRAIEYYKKIIPVNFPEELYNNELQNIQYYQTIAILNTIAHYNHYFTDHKKCSAVSSILYFPDDTSYQKHTELVDILKRITKFIPGTHFVDQITGNRPLFQAHVPTMITNHIKKQYKLSNDNLHVYIIGATPIDYMMFKIIPSVYVLQQLKYTSINKTYNPISTLQDILCEKLHIPSDIAYSLEYKQELFTIYTTLLILYRSYIQEYFPSLKIPKFNIKTNIIYDKKKKITNDSFKLLLRSPYTTSYELNRIIFNALVINSDSEQISREFWKFYYIIESSERSDVKTIISQLLPYWTKKLYESSKLAKTLSSALEVTNKSQTLNIDWLLEGKIYE